ncbi:unnamed protein product [Paramecium octaurelia]|uniref:G domain-containing protein n=1 Tax=Paramecium octaurelia TaxID=43137 RepID=A0A8S1XTF3_PAROT|nr:unnamed protein product [Paramecium octaurelia]
MLKSMNIKKESYNAQQLSPSFKRIILYFNLTDCFDSLIELEKLQDLKLLSQNTIYSEFEVQSECHYQQSLHFYYFQKLVQENKIDEIDIFNLTILRINLLKLAQQFGKCYIKVVIQYNNIIIQNNQNLIEKHINQLFDGFLTEQQEVILVSSNLKQKKVICYLRKPIIHQDIIQINSLNFKDIIFQDLVSQIFQCKEFNSQFISHLQSSYGYFQFEYNDFCSVGFECYLYIQDQLEVLSYQILKNVQMFQYNINELLELPNSLKGQNLKDEDIHQFQKLLNSLIIRFWQILNEKNISISIIIKQIHWAIQYWEPRILNRLRNLAQKNLSFSTYANKEKIFIFQFEQIIEAYQEKQKIFQDETQDETLSSFLKQDFEMISNQCAVEVQYFDTHLPYRFKLFQKSNTISNQQKPIQKTNICVLGLTKTGKSTLLNILINPENITIIDHGNRMHFSTIDKQNGIEISQTCQSETKSIVDQEIDDFVFTDTPGFEDTDRENRLINQIKIFSQLQRSPQIIFLILIDGSKLCENKNNLQSTIEHINLFFGEKLFESQLENFIIPVFNRLESDTMKYINNIWDKEIEANISNDNISYFLKAIKNRIDKERYIQLLNASKYFDETEIQNLIKEKQKIQDQITQLLRDNRISEQLISLNQQVIQLQEQIDNKSTQKPQINYELLKGIKSRIFDQCRQLQNEQKQQQAKIGFNLELNAEMKESYDIILQYQDQICQRLLKQVTDVIINNILNDHSRNVDDVINLCSQLSNIVQNFKKQENISVFAFFDSLIQQFHNLFINQRLVMDLIDKLKSVNNLSQFINNGQKIQNISVQYLEDELELVKKSSSQVQNNQQIKNSKFRNKWKKLRISFFKFIRLVEKAQTLEQSTKLRYERLRMIILKDEYEQLKKSQAPILNQ